MFNHAQKWNHVLCGSAELWDRKLDVVKEPKMWDQVNCLACCWLWSDPLFDNMIQPTPITAEAEWLLQQKEFKDSKD